MLFFRDLINFLYVVNGSQESVDYSRHRDSLSCLAHNEEIIQISDPETSPVSSEVKKDTIPREQSSCVKSKLHQSISKAIREKIFKKRRVSAYYCDTNKIQDLETDNETDEYIDPLDLRKFTQPLYISYTDFIFYSEPSSEQKPIVEIDYLSILKNNSFYKDKQEISQPEPNFVILKPRVSTQTNESSNLPDSKSIYNKTSFLDTFAEVILELEDQFIQFMQIHAGIRHRINDVLYCKNLKKFDMFTKRYFTPFEYINNEFLEILSQNATLLYEFIQNLDLTLDGKLILKLISGFNFDDGISLQIILNPEHFIIKKIYTFFGEFLSCKESRYFKGFAIEFISFIYNRQTIHSGSFNLHVRAFFSILISVKRNSHVLPDMIKAFGSMDRWESIDFIIRREMCITSIFTYTFMRFHSEAVKIPTLLYNMRFYITINSLMIQTKKYFVYFSKNIENVCMLMPYIFFDLVTLNKIISLNPTKKYRDLKIDWVNVESSSKHLICKHVVDILESKCDLIYERLIQNAGHLEGFEKRISKINQNNETGKKTHPRYTSRLNYLCFTVSVFEDKQIKSLISKLKRSAEPRRI